MDDRIEKLHRSLTNHSPSPEQIERIEEIRSHAKAYGEAFLAAGGPSREAALAMTALEESTMWAVKSVILNEGD